MKDNVVHKKYVNQKGAKMCKFRYKINRNFGGKIYGLSKRAFSSNQYQQIR